MPGFERLKHPASPAVSIGSFAIEPVAAMEAGSGAKFGTTSNGQPLLPLLCSRQEKH